MCVHPWLGVGVGGWVCVHVWLGVAGCGWAWLGVAGRGWAWLGVAGHGWVWVVGVCACVAGCGGVCGCFLLRELLRYLREHLQFGLQRCRVTAAHMLPGHKLRVPNELLLCSCSL